MFLPRRRRVLGNSRWSSANAGSRAGFVNVEFLERRTLLTATLEIDATTHALSYVEQSGFANDTTVQVVAGATPMLQINEAGSDIIGLGANAIAAGWSLSLDGKTATGSESSASSVLIDTNDGPDVVVLASADIPVTVSPTNGATDDEVDLGGANGGSPGQTEGITSSVTIQNAGGKTSVIANDTGDTTARTISVNDTGITGLTGLPVTYDASTNAVSIKTGGVANTVSLSNTSAAKNWLVEDSGNDTVNVHSVASTSALTIEGVNSGHPTLNVTNNGSLQGIQGPITVDSNNLIPAVTIDGSADTTPMNVMVADDSSITGLAPALIMFPNTMITALTLDAGTAGNTIEWNWTTQTNNPPATSTINTGAGNDIVNVLGTPSQTTLNINGQAGTNAINLGVTPQGGDAVMLLGTVNVEQATGTTNITLDNALEQLASTANISDTGITGLTTAPITYTSPTSVNVVGETMGDTFNVTPSATTAFSIDGGPFAPAAAPADTLNVDTSKGLLPAINETSSANGLSGTFTFSNRKSITFSRIGTVTSSITGKAFNLLTGAAISNTEVFLDLNDNNMKDAGEPSINTDASGNYTFADLMPGQYHVDIFSSAPVPAPVAVTVAAGSVVSAPDFVASPTPVNSGPDLTGAFVGAPTASVIGGAKGRARLRITNSSTATANAKGKPQISIFASTDGLLDPSDTPIGTVSGGNINLRKGASKIDVLSFTWPKTLPTGHYFLLASVDTTNVIAETNETNNLAVASAATLITAPFVDLAGTFAHPPKTLKTTRPAIVALTLQNLGNVAAVGTIDFSLVASVDQAVDGSDSKLATNVPVKINIPSNKSRPVHVRIAAGASVAAGSYFIIVTANSTQSLPESSFENNVIVSAKMVAIR